MQRLRRQGLSHVHQWKSDARSTRKAAPLATPASRPTLTVTGSLKFSAERSARQAQPRHAINMGARCHLCYVLMRIAPNAEILKIQSHKYRLHSIRPPRAAQVFEHAYKTSAARTPLGLFSSQLQNVREHRSITARVPQLRSAASICTPNFQFSRPHLKVLFECKNCRISVTKAIAPVESRKLQPA